MPTRHAPLLILGAALATAGVVDAGLLAALGGPGPQQPAATTLAALAGAHGLVGAAAGWALHRRQRRKTRSLAALASQARDIGLGRFTQVQQPDIPEHHALAKALNVAAEQLRAMFVDRDRRLGALREQVDLDPVTGLGSAVQFGNQLQAQLSPIAPLGMAPNAQAGMLAVVRVDDLAGLNRRLGRDRADELLRAVAALLRLRLVTLGDDASAARLNGADFAVLAPGVDDARFSAWLGLLASALDALRSDQLTDRPQTAWIGAASYGPGDEAELVLNRANAMLQACEHARTPWQLSNGAQPLHGLSGSQWRQLIEAALDTGHITLQPFDVLTPAMALIHQEAMVRLHLPDGRVLDGDELMPAATRTGRSVDIDLRVVELALAQIAADGQPLAVNVAPHSIRRPSFIARLVLLLDAAPQAAARLALEVDEAVLVHGRDDLERLAQALAPYATRLGLDHFQERLADLPGLGVMPLHYVKLDAGNLSRLQEPGGSQRFVQLCQSICAAEGLRLIACGVDTEADLVSVRRQRLDGCTGRAVVRPLAATLSDWPAAPERPATLA